MTLVEGIAWRGVVGQWVIRRLLIHGNDDDGGCVSTRVFCCVSESRGESKSFFCFFRKIEFLALEFCGWEKQDINAPPTLCKFKQSCC